MYAPTYEHCSNHVGMDTLYSQSLSKSKKSIGEQVITRTISFHNTFDDLPLQDIDGMVLERRITYMDIRAPFSLTPTAAGPSVDTEMKTAVVKSFEEKLSEWLLDCIRGRGETVDSSDIKGASPNDTKMKFNSSAAKLTKYLNMNAERQTAFQEVVKDCYLFLEATGVTHYVHLIQLGAMKFRVLSSTEYNKKVGVKGNVGVEKVAKSTLGVSASSQKKTSSQYLSVKEIGRMTADGTVKMGTRDEAVIGFKLMPIQRLVMSYHISEALKQALRDYIVKRAVKSSKYSYVTIVYTLQN